MKCQSILFNLYDYRYAFLSVDIQLFEIHTVCFHIDKTCKLLPEFNLIMIENRYSWGWNAYNDLWIKYIATV